MTVSALPSKTPQLTLNFEPELADDYPTLRAFIAHRLQHQKRPAKSIAGDMDLAPSTLSRKLSPSDGDTQRFNCDDLESYMRITGDTTPIKYLASKYLHSDTHRKARLLARLDEAILAAERAAAAVREAA